MNFRNQDSAQWSHSPLCRESFYSFRSHTLLQFEDASTNFSPRFPVLSQLTPPSLPQGTLSSGSVHHRTALVWSSRHRLWQIKCYMVWNPPVRPLLAFPHHNRRRQPARSLSWKATQPPVGSSSLLRAPRSLRLAREEYCKAGLCTSTDGELMNGDSCELGD